MLGGKGVTVSHEFICIHYFWRSVKVRYNFLKMAADRSVLAEVDQNIEPNQSYPEFVASLKEAEEVLQGFEKTNVSRFSCKKSPKGFGSTCLSCEYGQ